MASIVGDNLNNVLNGTDANDSIFGLGGRDILRGFAGNDGIDGGSGDDVLYGDDGNDTFRDGPGNDVINGGNGLDWVVYADATARVIVDLRTQSATGGGGSDTLRSIEIVDGSRFDDSIVGDALDNTLRGSDGNDELFGGEGNDQLGGKAGQDRLYGGPGDDVLSDGDTGNLFAGGEGRDEAYFVGTNAPLEVDLAAGICRLGGGTNTFSSIEDVRGAANLNRLLGDGNANAFHGWNLDDFLDGRAGADALWGYDGSDTIYGGNGNDRLEGGAGNDRLFGQNGNDTINGGEGADSIVDTAGRNTISAGAGNDHVVGSGVVDGGAGDDDLYGHGATVLRGGDGRDLIRCGEGAQTIDYDRITDDDPSGVGPIYAREAIFHFRRADGDRIDLSDIDANSRVAGNQAFTFVGTSVVDQAGELGIVVSGGVTYVVAETNGTVGWELMIETRNSTIGVAADFIL